MNVCIKGIISSLMIYIYYSHQIKFLLFILPFSIFQHAMHYLEFTSSHIHSLQVNSSVKSTRFFTPLETKKCSRNGEMYCTKQTQTKNYILLFTIDLGTFIDLFKYSLTLKMHWSVKRTLSENTLSLSYKNTQIHVSHLICFIDMMKDN